MTSSLHNTWLYRFVYEYYENRNYSGGGVVLFTLIYGLLSLCVIASYGKDVWMGTYFVNAIIITIFRIPTVKTECEYNKLRKYEHREHGGIMRTPKYLFYVTYVIPRGDYEWTFANVVGSILKLCFIWIPLVVMCVYPSTMSCMIFGSVSYVLTLVWWIVVVCSDMKGYYR